MSIIRRALISDDKNLVIRMTAILCDTDATAKKQLRHLLKQSSKRFTRGTYLGAKEVGDETWSMVPHNAKPNIFVLHKNLIIELNSSRSLTAARNQSDA